VQGLRLPAALIGLGFLGVLAWTIAYLIAVLPTFDTATVLVYWLTTTAGYVLAGFACWRWIVGNWNARESRSFTPGPSRLMSAASFVTAAGVAALTYQLYQNNPSFALDNLDFHYGLRLGGGIVGTLGFLLAAAGFWIASSARPADPETEKVLASETEGGPHSPRLSDSADDVMI
jgi:hypothetical protein